jgi:drug/metabolite transporter (DMT)-like permease
LGVGSFNTLVYSGLQHTVVINALLLQSLMPIAVVAFSSLFFRDRVSLRQGLGILLSLAGAVFVIFEGRLGAVLAFRLNPGDGLVLVAVVCYAAYTALLRLRPALHPLSFLLATFALGSTMILPFYLWETFAGRAVHPNAPTLASVLYVAVFPSILSYLFYNRGVALIGANRAGLFAHLMPLFGSLLAVALLGEAFRGYHAVGLALILSGILLASVPTSGGGRPKARGVDWRHGRRRTLDP